MASVESPGPGLLVGSARGAVPSFRFPWIGDAEVKGLGLALGDDFGAGVDLGLFNGFGDVAGEVGSLGEGFGRAEGAGVSMGRETGFGRGVALVFTFGEGLGVSVAVALGAAEVAGVGLGVGKGGSSDVLEGELTGGGNAGRSGV